MPEPQPRILNPNGCIRNPTYMLGPEPKSQIGNLQSTINLLLCSTRSRAGLQDPEAEARQISNATSLHSALGFLANTKALEP